MTHLEGTLRDSRPIPRMSRYREGVAAAPEVPALLDEIEEALFGVGEQPVQFTAPLHESVLLEKNAVNHREFARPIRSIWQRGFRVVRYSMLASMIGYGGFLGYSIWYGPNSGETMVSAQTHLNYTRATVVETPVSKQTIQSYEVASSQPKRLQLAGQNIHARVYAQGMTNEAQLLGATNSNDIAWYNGSAMPGRSGVSVMVGTLAGPTKASNFANAPKTAVGDKITVTMGDDSAVFYHVTSVRTINGIDDMSAFLSQGVGPETLKIVLRDKTKQTDETGKSSVLIVGERFQDPQPKYKSLRRW